MSSSGDAGAINKERTEQLIHSRINSIRTFHGKGILEYDTDLRAIARAHSKDMADRDFFAHKNPDGETVTDRYKRHGYHCQVVTDSSAFRTTYSTGGENIARTAIGIRVKTANDVKRSEDENDIGTTVVRGWMESDGHRENLLQDHWVREGIGMYLDDSSGPTNVFVTQNFC